MDASGARVPRSKADESRARPAACSPRARAGRRERMVDAERARRPATPRSRAERGPATTMPRATEDNGAACEVDAREPSTIHGHACCLERLPREVAWRGVAAERDCAHDERCVVILHHSDRRPVRTRARIDSPRVRGVNERAQRRRSQRRVLATNVPYRPHHASQSSARFCRDDRCLTIGLHIALRCG